MQHLEKILIPVEMNQSLINYILQLADNNLILGQRLSEWCGHAPELEIDIALTNIALDLIGQSRNLYQYAAELEGKGRSEDDIAYLRDSSRYRNVLLVEQPNEDFAYTIARQFFFDVYNHLFYQELTKSKDERLAEIAEKSLKEVRYHCRWSSEWVCRLGDGTPESHERLLAAIENLWPYTGELFVAAPYEIALHIDTATSKANWMEAISTLFAEATLPAPSLTSTFMQTGGKTGQHTEALGYLLAELQYVQRSYPGSEW